MKPKKFSSVLNLQWKMFSKQKSRNPNWTAEEIYNGIHSEYYRQFPNIGESNEGIASIRAWEIWYHDYKRELLHVFFLDKALRDILQDMPIRFDFLKEFVREHTQKEVMWSDIYRGNVECDTYCFAIHVPNEDNGYAFKLTLLDDTLNCSSIQENVGGFDIDEEAYRYFIKNKETSSCAKVKKFQLCVNTLLYMDCYPECIKDGAPDFLSENHNTELKEATNKSLGLSDAFVQIKAAGSAKRPYPKGGYFMTFSNERYTKARGTTKFIPPQFIKGKAITVEKADNLDNLKN